MKTKRLSGFFSLCVVFFTISAMAQPEMEWYRLYDGVGWRDGAEDVVVDSNDDIIVAGSSSTALDWSARDWHTIKYDRFGNEIWGATYATDNSDYVRDACLDRDDNVILTGQAPTDAGAWMTVKLAPDGTMLWDSPGIGGAVVIADRNSDLYTVRTEGSYPEVDVLLTKLARSGEALWTQQFDLGGQETVYDMIPGQNDNVCILVESGSGGATDGHYLLVVDPSGNVVATENVERAGLQPRRIAHGAEDSIFVASENPATGGIHVTKHGPLLNMIWESTYVPFDAQYGARVNIAGLAIDSRGQAIVAGTWRRRTYSGFETVRFDAQGNLNWQTRFRYEWYMFASGVAVDSRDNFYVTGATYACYTCGHLRYMTVKYSVGPSTPEEYIEEIIKTIVELPDTAFDPKQSAKNRINALLNKLAVVIRHIENDQHRQAADKLENDIVPKLDGCLGGDPRNDWIVDCAAQQDILGLIEGLLELLQDHF